MRKIPTLLVRDPEDRAHVLGEVTPGCEWVLDGEGRATRKYDGTCVMFDGNAWWARREVKPGKATPSNFQAIETDETTGKTVGWVPIEQSSFREWFNEAIQREPTGVVPATGTYELLGPRINGNPERLYTHWLYRHAAAERVGPSPKTVEQARALVQQLGHDAGWEGVVWHHPDGRMAKLKARDLP